MEELQICTYNCRGLPKDKKKLALKPDISTLFDTNHIIIFQETWYSKQNLNIINSLHPSFDGIGVAKVDESNGIIQGRYSGGVAIMWRKELGRYIRRLDLAVDWCAAIEIAMDSTKFVIFNIYLPYQCNENEEEYVNCLSGIRTFIEDLDNTNFLIIGDWNANLGNSGTTLFKPLMLDFCNDNQLVVSSKHFLPDSTYTHVHMREGNYYYSWLDHIVSSSDFHNSIQNINVYYDMTDNDHIPVRLVMQVDRLQKLSITENNVSSNIKWDCLSDQCIKHYHDRTTKAFGEIDIPISSVLCSDCACASKTHTGEIDKLFDAMKSSLYESSVHCQPGKSRYTPRPGWNDYVSDIYDFSREARRMWLDQGKPRQGMVHDMFVKSKRRLKCALNYITKNEDSLRK